jgi:hypothetical protein
MRSTGLGVTMAFGRVGGIVSPVLVGMLNRLSNLFALGIPFNPILFKGDSFYIWLC